MKLLYLHQHFSTPEGSTGIRSYAMARKMIEAGHSVTMVCGSNKLGQTGIDAPFAAGRRRGMVDGIDIIEFDLSYSNNDNFLKRSLTFMRFALGSVGVVLRERYDLLFATTTPLTVVIPALAARWLRAKRYVFEVRDLWPELPREMGVITNSLVLSALSMLEWLGYRNAQSCIALSPGIANGIARRGVPAERIAIIPNGCDLDIFQGGAQPWRPGGVRGTDLMAVFTGAHGIANGLGAALAVARELRRRGRDDIKLVLIGDGKLKDSLVEAARREGLDNVLFHAPVSKSRLAGLMRSADLGLQLLANIPAFYFGTSPNKFFDYIAAGLPVLCNYPGWLAEIIAAEQCGFAVPPDDPAAFADALEAAQADRTALKAMGERGFAVAERDFDRNLLADHWVASVSAGAI